MHTIVRYAFPSFSGAWLSCDHGQSYNYSWMFIWQPRRAHICELHVFELLLNLCEFEFRNSKFKNSNSCNSKQVTDFEFTIMCKNIFKICNCFCLFIERVSCIFGCFTFAKFRSSKKYKNGWIVARVFETVDKNSTKHQGRKYVDCRGKNEVWCWWYSRDSQGKERAIGMGRTVTVGLIKE